MCLTEPHWVRSPPLPSSVMTASEERSASFLVETDFSGNIVHLVLIRTVGARAGTKGISLFVVPEHDVLPSGGLDQRYNGVPVGDLSFSTLKNSYVPFIGSFTIPIEQKMDSHGSATCELTFDNSRGYLVGAD